MLLTEEEASHKHCPRCMDVAENTVWPCCGSKCAAWRWGEDMPYETIPKPKEEICFCSDCELEFMQSFEGHEWEQTDRGWKCPQCLEVHRKVIDHPESRRGFCGLAGEVKHA